MATEIKVPNLPESVSSATVATWHFKVGDKVTREANLLDLETDKVMLEVPATDDGVITEIRAEAGATVQAGDVLAVLGGAGEAAAPAPAATPAPATASSQPASASTQSEPAASADKPTTGPMGAPALGGETALPKSDSSASDGADHAARTAAANASQGTPGPAARKAMAENDLSAGDVSGSGKGGRVTKEDVQRHLDGQQGGGQPAPTAPAATPAPAPAAAAPQPAAPAPTPAPPPAAKAPAAAPAQARGPGPSRGESRVPMTRIRATIAKRLKDSQNTAAMLTTFNEVNLTQVNALRARYKDTFEKAHGVKVGYMGFFVRAAVEALKRYPAVNASIDGNDVVYHEYYDVGVAVSSPRGLVVPVIKDVDTLSLAGVEKAIGDFGKKAKDNKLTLDDLSGGTFSITNGGVFGSLLSTPILNPPQSAILGMHGINERLLDVVVDADGRVKEIVKAPMMYLALTYDHRIIDGREAVLFLRTIKELLEDPARLLLEI